MTINEIYYPIICMSAKYYRKINIIFYHTLYESETELNLVV